MSQNLYVIYTCRDCLAVNSGYRSRNITPGFLVALRRMAHLRRTSRRRWSPARRDGDDCTIPYTLLKLPRSVNPHAPTTRNITSQATMPCSWLRSPDLDSRCELPVKWHDTDTMVFLPQKCCTEKWIIMPAQRGERKPGNYTLGLVTAQRGVTSGCMSSSTSAAASSCLERVAPVV